MRIIAEAPCRIDLSGGTLVIWPLYALSRFTRSGHGPEKIREIAQNVEAQTSRVPTGAPRNSGINFAHLARIASSMGGGWLCLFFWWSVVGKNAWLKFCLCK
jgi:hypothetical protein